ncbi:MAG: hypothetical protein LBQ73_11795 [Tannerellaceae bacterium]|jgi:hypothetical protein|nr:hypothetical protein [Tannerellaceae bacterium]
MRNAVVYVTCSIVLTLAGCGSREKEARAMLDNAKVLYENYDFIAAKNEMDSIRARYPKEVKVLKETLELMRKVELKEAERNIAYCDSLLPVRQEEAAEAVKGFSFEKDSVYEDLGKYIRQRKTLERNVERTYIRYGVNEKGEMYLTSVYFGSQPINHTGIKVSTKDGLFAETASIPYDGGVNYRFKDEGNTSEIVNYQGENGIDAIKFIYANAKERIKVDFTGGKPYGIYLEEADKKDLAATYDLANILSEIHGLTIEREKSLKKKAYLEGKLN